MTSGGKLFPWVFARMEENRAKAAWYVAASCIAICIVVTIALDGDFWGEISNMVTAATLTADQVACQVQISSGVG